jgi:hypothetical protein
MSNATAIEAIIPDIIQKIDGVTWFMIYNEGTFEAFKSLPNVVEMDGKLYKKMGWSSDTFTVHYKNVHKSQIAFPT